jgi:HEPN domain-containing protein
VNFKSKKVELMLKVEYVLPGKLQTDNLERRFSAYRQLLSGGNYNVSVTQILEAEKKRIKSILGLKSAKHGIIPFTKSTLPITSEDSVNLEEEMALDLRRFSSILKTNYSI